MTEKDFLKKILMEPTHSTSEKEIARMNVILKKHENDLSLKVSVSDQSQPKSLLLVERLFACFSNDIDWKSFAFGAFALAAILFFIYQKI